MERLTESDRQAISKINTASLLAKLTNLGFDEEVLANLERKYLLSLYAQATADGIRSQTKATPPLDIPKLGNDIEVVKLHISIEIQRHAELIALEKQKLIIKQQRVCA